jgi:hypothetical protein
MKTIIPCSGLANELAAKTAHEIEQLIEFVNSSSCQFNRNGSWYPASEAAAHIEKKYRYALDKDRVHSTEDFINYAATKSSITDKPYKVQCKGNQEINCAAWLTSQLSQIRQHK